MDGCPPRLMSEGVRLVLISERGFIVRVVWEWCITKEITQGIVLDVQPWVIYF